MDTVALEPSSPLLIDLPARKVFGSRVRVEFEAKILIAFLRAAAPELARLERLRVGSPAQGSPADARLDSAGVADNDARRLMNALIVHGLATPEDFRI